MKKYPLGRKIPNNCHFILNGRVLSPLDFNWEVTDSGNHAFVEKKLLLEPGSVLHIDCHKGARRYYAQYKLLRRTHSKRKVFI
jgi:hypothetical protein